MKEEDQHTKIPSPHRTLSLNPPYPSISYVTPAAGPFFPMGIILNLEGDATYQILSIYALRFQSRRFLMFSLNKPM